MSLPNVGDTVYIVGKVISTHNQKRPYVRIETKSKDIGDSFLLYSDQITLVETPEEATACAD